MIGTWSARIAMENCVIGCRSLGKLRMSFSTQSGTLERARQSSVRPATCGCLQNRCNNAEAYARHRSNSFEDIKGELARGDSCGYKCTQDTAHIPVDVRAKHKCAGDVGGVAAVAQC